MQPLPGWLLPSRPHFLAACYWGPAWPFPGPVQASCSDQGRTARGTRFPQLAPEATCHLC